MAMYYGLKAIAARMGCSSTALMTSLYERPRFLMYRRWLVLPTSRKPRLVWITNDELITRWETAQCLAQYAARPPKQRMTLDTTARTRAQSAPMPQRDGPQPQRRDRAPGRNSPGDPPSGQVKGQTQPVVVNSAEVLDSGSASEQERNDHA